MSLVHIRSAQFRNVFLRLYGQDLGIYMPIGGVVNAQFGSGPWETFNKIDNPDGSVSFRSNAFPEVFLFLDGNGLTQFNPAGGGYVAGEYLAESALVKFNIVTNPDGTQSIGSQAFPNVFLRLDGTNVTEYNLNGSGVVNAQYTHSTFESFVINDCLTPERCNQAINQFIQMFPEEANSINANRQTIVNACCPAYSPTVVDLATLPEVRYTYRPPEFLAEDPGISPCATAVVKAAFDCLSLVASLFGVGVQFNQQQRRALYEAIGNVPEKLIVLLDAIKNTTGVDRALAIGKYIGGLWNVGAFKAWWGVVTKSLSWWQWVVVGVTVVAQVIAWIATEWVAFAAEVVLVVASLPSLIADVITAVSACSTSSAMEPVLALA